MAQFSHFESLRYSEHHKNSRQHERGHVPASLIQRSRQNFGATSRKRQVSTGPDAQQHKHVKSAYLTTVTPTSPLIRATNGRPRSRPLCGALRRPQPHPRIYHGIPPARESHGAARCSLLRTARHGTARQGTQTHGPRPSSHLPLRAAPATGVATAAPQPPPSPAAGRCRRDCGPGTGGGGVGVHQCSCRAPRPPRPVFPPLPAHLTAAGPGGPEPGWDMADGEAAGGGRSAAARRGERCLAARPVPPLPAGPGGPGQGVPARSSNAGAACVVWLLSRFGAGGGSVDTFQLSSGVTDSFTAFSPRGRPFPAASCRGLWIPTVLSAKLLVLWWPQPGTETCPAALRLLSIVLTGYLVRKLSQYPSPWSPHRTELLTNNSNDSSSRIRQGLSWSHRAAGS